MLPEAILDDAVLDKAVVGTLEKVVIDAEFLPDTSPR